MGQPKEINSRLADIKPRLGSRSLYTVATESNENPSSQTADKNVSSEHNVINDLPPSDTDINVINDIKEPFVAPQVKSSSRKKGRKPKYGTNLTEPITVNFTPEEKAKLEARSAQLLGAPLTAIIRDALHEKGLI